MAIKNILIVDDLPIERENIKEILREAGYHAETAGSGEEGLQKLESYRPDLIFMDIVMPDMDGFHACREITNNDKTKDIPVVFVSSKGQEVDKVWGQLQGAKGHISKPYSKEGILQMVDEINQKIVTEIN